MIGKKPKKIFFCSEPTHDDNTLTVVCTDITCPKNGVICASCMLESHMNHSSYCMKLKDYLANYNEFFQKSTQKKGKILVYFYHCVRIHKKIF